MEEVVAAGLPDTPAPDSRLPLQGIAVARYLAYTSTAQAGLAPAQIDELLLDARNFNARIGVTGVLLYDGRRFFQYFEGTDYATEQVMERIRQSSRHDQINLLADARRDGHEFDRWYMGLCQSTPTFMQRLENSNWQQTLYRLRSRPGSSPALETLNTFLAEQSRSELIERALMDN